MEAIAYIFVGIYLIALLFITLYALLELQLLYLYLRNYPSIKNYTPPPLNTWPHVTIQLPLYNELYVVERLIDDICKIDYPTDKIEIQVLDDSTDESTEIAKKKVYEYQAKGVNIKYIHRTNKKRNTCEFSFCWI